MLPSILRGSLRENLLVAQHGAADALEVFETSYDALNGKIMLTICAIQPVKVSQNLMPKIFGLRQLLAMNPLNPNRRH
jgi:hypothetical protein